MEIPTIKIDIDRKPAEAGLKGIDEAAKKLITSLGGINAKTKTLNRGLNKTSDGARKLGTQAGRTSKQVRGLNFSLFESAKAAQFAFGPLSGLAARMTAFGALVKATSIGVGVFIVAIAAFTLALGLSVREAIRFNKAMTEVRKNAGLTATEFVSLSGEVRQISKDTGIAAEKIANIADQAGRLGIKGVQNLSQFTRAIAELTVVTNLTEGAATEFARLLNITGEGVDRIGVLGATIVELGANIAATESEILSFSVEIARATAVFGVSATEAEAFGAALAALGNRPEAVRTALQKVFNTIVDGLIGVEKKKKVLEEIFQEPIAIIARDFDRNASKVLLRFFEGLKRIKDEGKLVTAELKKLDLTDVRAASVVLSGVAGVKQLQKAFSIQQAQAILPTGTAKQFTTFLETPATQLARAGSELADVAGAIGTGLLPAVTATTKVFTKLLDVLRFILLIKPPNLETLARTTLFSGLLNVLDRGGIKPQGTTPSPGRLGVPVSGPPTKFEDLAGLNLGNLKAKFQEQARLVALGGTEGKDAIKFFASVEKVIPQFEKLAKEANLTAVSTKAVGLILDALKSGIAQARDTIASLDVEERARAKAVQDERARLLRQRQEAGRVATGKLAITELGTPLEKLRLATQNQIEKIQESLTVEAEKRKQIRIVQEAGLKKAAALLDKQLATAIKNGLAIVKAEERADKLRLAAAKKQAAAIVRATRETIAKGDALVAGKLRVATVLGDKEGIRKARFAQDLRGLQKLFKESPGAFGGTTREQQRTFGLAVKRLAAGAKTLDKAAAQLEKGLSAAFFQLLRGSTPKDVLASFSDKLQDIVARRIADKLGKATAKSFTKLGESLQSALKDVFKPLLDVFKDLAKDVSDAFGDFFEALGQGAIIGAALTGGSRAGTIGGAAGGGAGLVAGTAIGAAIGGPAGAAAGAAIGTVIGSVAGSLIGKGIFGGAGPEAIVQIGTAFNSVFAQVVQGSAKAVAAARSAGNELASIFNKLSDSFKRLGESLDPFSKLLSGTALTVNPKRKKPFRIVINGKRLKFETIDEVAVALIQQGLGEGAFAGSGPILQKVLKTVSIGASLSDIQSAVDFAVDFGTGFGTLLPVLTDFEKELETLKNEFEKARASAAKFGLSIKAIDLAEQIKLQKKQIDFNQQIKLSILDIVDPLGAALERLKVTQATRLKDAMEIGANITAVEKLNALERQAAVEQFANKASSVLRDFLVSITASPTSKLPTTVSLANAQRRFSELRSGFLGGDTSLADALVDASRNLLDLRRALDASGPGFFQTQALVEDTITKALEVRATEGDPQLEILKELNLDIREGNMTLEEIRAILASMVGGAGDGGVAPGFTVAPPLDIRTPGSSGGGISSGVFFGGGNSSRASVTVS